MRTIEVRRRLVERYMADQLCLGAKINVLTTRSIHGAFSTLSSRAVRIASASSRQCPASTSSFGRTRSRLPTASSNLPLLISHLGASAVDCQWSLTGVTGSVDYLRMTKRPRNTTNGQQTWIDTGVIHLRDQSAFIQQLTTDLPGSLRGL